MSEPTHPGYMPEINEHLSEGEMEVIAQKIAEKEVPLQTYIDKVNPHNLQSSDREALTSAMEAIYSKSSRYWGPDFCEYVKDKVIEEGELENIPVRYGDFQLVVGTSSDLTHWWFELQNESGTRRLIIDPTGIAVENGEYKFEKYTPYFGDGRSAPQDLKDKFLNQAKIFRFERTEK